MEVSAKPRRDPVTGCAHIKNWEHPAFGVRRCCSYCYSALARTADEKSLASCPMCGERFNHEDDDPMLPDEEYD